MASITQGVAYGTEKPLVTVLLESDFTKEIRISFREGQVMKEHRTPFPIVLEIVEGEIDFGVSAIHFKLHKGDLMSLSGNIPHDLTALSDSIVRLTLSKEDKAERVKTVVTKIV